MHMEIVTKRLLLRDWQDADAEALFAFCRDPAIGEGAGFPPHGSLEESRAILRQVLMQPRTMPSSRARAGRSSARRG